MVKENIAEARRVAEITQSIDQPRKGGSSARLADNLKGLVAELRSLLGSSDVSDHTLVEILQKHNSDVNAAASELLDETQGFHTITKKKGGKKDEPAATAPAPAQRGGRGGNAGAGRGGKPRFERTEGGEQQQRERTPFAGGRGGKFDRPRDNAGPGRGYNKEQHAASAEENGHQKSAPAPRGPHSAAPTAAVTEAPAQQQQQAAPVTAKPVVHAPAPAAAPSRTPATSGGKSWANIARGQPVAPPPAPAPAPVAAPVEIASHAWTSSIIDPIAQNGTTWSAPAQQSSKSWADSSAAVTEVSGSAALASAPPASRGAWGNKNESHGAVGARTAAKPQQQQQQAQPQQAQQAQQQPETAWRPRVQSGEEAAAKQAKEEAALQQQLELHQQQQAAAAAAAAAQQEKQQQAAAAAAAAQQAQLHQQQQQQLAAQQQAAQTAQAQQHVTFGGRLHHQAEAGIQFGDFLGSYGGAVPAGPSTTASETSSIGDISGAQATSQHQQVQQQQQQPQAQVAQQAHGFLNGGVDGVSQVAGGQASQGLFQQPGYPQDYARMQQQMYPDQYMYGGVPMGQNQGKSFSQPRGDNGQRRDGNNRNNSYRQNTGAAGDRGLGGPGQDKGGLSPQAAAQVAGAQPGMMPMMNPQFSAMYGYMNYPYGYQYPPYGYGGQGFGAPQQFMGGGGIKGYKGQQQGYSNPAMGYSGQADTASYEQQQQQYLNYYHQMQQAQQPAQVPSQLGAGQQIPQQPQVPQQQDLAGRADKGAFSNAGRGGARQSPPPAGADAYGQVGNAAGYYGNANSSYYGQMGGNQGYYQQQPQPVQATPPNWTTGVGGAQ